MRVKDAVGRFGEDLARTFLIEKHYRILDSNWRCGDGELDIVACTGDVLVFVEVKTRSSVAFGDPAEAVSPVKAARIRRLAVRWLAERHRSDPGEHWRDMRFDVISVIRRTDTGPSVRHLPAAF